MEPFALREPLRSCCNREFGDRGSGEARLLGVPRGEERKRGRPKEEVAVDFGLRLNEILLLCMSFPLLDMGFR